jgi:hypothetical protein
MIVRTIRGGFVVEWSRAYAFVKVGQWEVYADFSRDGGPAGRRFVFSRCAERPRSAAEASS